MLCRAACSGDLPRLQALGPATWWVAAARGAPDPGNGGVTVQALVARDGEARIWLVGSGPTPAYGARLACAIQAATGAAVTDIVDTRAAPELAMGSVAFAGARIWALPDVMRVMQARCATCQANLKAEIGAVAGASLVPASIRAPTRSVGEGDRGSVGPFDWIAFERAPGERVLVLRHRADHVVVAQGLVWAGDVPDLRNLSTAMLERSLVALEDWIGSSDALLGEQGGVADARALRRELDYLAALRGVVAPALARGDLLGQDALELPPYAALPSYAQRHPLNVQHLWAELEPGLFR